MKNLKPSISFILLLTLLSCNEVIEHQEQVKMESASIINGTVDRSQEYQSTVKLIGRTKPCSGVVIHPRLVVSNAHCADSDLYAVAARDLTKGVDFFKSSKIMKVIPHENYKDGHSKKDDIALFILKDRIFLKEYPLLVEDMYDFYALLRASGGELTSVGFGIDENDKDNYDRRFANAIFMEDYEVCGDSVVDQNYLISNLVTDRGDSGGGIYTTFKDRKFLLGINMAQTTVKKGLAECKYSKGYKLYRYKKWFRDIGFDVFSNDKELLNEQIENYLLQDKVVSDNFQDSLELQSNPTYGQSVGIKINSAMVLRAQEESKGLKLMFSYCDDSKCTLKSGYRNDMFVGRKFHFLETVPLLDLGELEDMYENENITKIEVALYNEDMSYGKFYIDIEELINQRVTVKTEAFFDMLYMDTELVLYDK